MHEFATAGYLDTWYSRTEANVLLEMAEKRHRKTAQVQMARVQERDRLRACAKLTEVVNGERRIIHDPPLLYRLEKHEADIREWLTELFVAYYESLLRDEVPQLRFVLSKAELARRDQSDE